MQNSDFMNGEMGAAKDRRTAETLRAVLHSIERLVEVLMQLLEDLRQDVRSNHESNETAFQALRDELSNIQKQITEIHQACCNDGKFKELADQLERLVIQTTHQNPSYETVNIIRDQVNAIRDMVKEELDAILDPKLDKLRQTIKLDFEEATKRQNAIQTWILGGISIVVAILGILLPRLLH